MSTLGGAHFDGVIFVDSDSALKIMQSGFFKDLLGLFWLTGVDRCLVQEHTAKISSDGDHFSTTKGRALKIQFLHELVGKLVKHVASARMKADPLTKQLPAHVFNRHLPFSFQLDS